MDFMNTLMAVSLAVGSCSATTSSLAPDPESAPVLVATQAPEAADPANPETRKRNAGPKGPAS